MKKPERAMLMDNSFNDERSLHEEAISRGSRISPRVGGEVRWRDLTWGARLGIILIVAIAIGLLYFGGYI